MAVDVKIQKNFGAFQLDVQFQSRSRRIGILGGSGCGKSLTLKSIAGIETPNQGKIVINGRVMFDSKEKKNLSQNGLHICRKNQISKSIGNKS